MKKFLLIAIVVLVFSVSSPTLSQNPTPISPANVEVAAQMDAAPTDCGPAPEPLSVSEYYAPVLGTWPIWGTISSGGREPEGIFSIPLERPQGSQLEGWWAQKVLWLVKTNYDGEVVLTGTNRSDDSPMYFTFGDSRPSLKATFNPLSPGAYAEGSDQFANFPSLVWVSKAGCYEIEAQWDGGLWRQIVAVGYIGMS